MNYLLLLEENAEAARLCKNFIPVWTVMGYVIFAIKVIVPILLILTGMIAFVKAVINQKDDEISKNKFLLIKKVVYAASVFLIIQLVGIIMNFVSSTSSYKICATCALSPFSDECYINKNSKRTPSKPTTLVEEPTHDTPSDEPVIDNPPIIEEEPIIDNPIEEVTDDEDEGEEDKPTTISKINVKPSYTVEVGKKIKSLYSLEPDNASGTVTLTSSNEKVAVITSKGVVKAVGEGTCTISIESDNGIKVTTSVTVKPKIEEAIVEENNDNPVDVYFLRAPSDSLKNNEAILIKTKDGKYVILDTGHSSDVTSNDFYTKLKELQNNKKVVVDYMILSHMHTDHIGNAADIMSTSNITVKNLIMKGEAYKSSATNKLVKAANDNNVPIVDVNEGEIISVGKYLDLYFYNVNDVFESAVKSGKCSSEYVGVGYTSDVQYASNFGTKDKPLYVYINGSEFASGEYKYHSSSTTSSITPKGINAYFYAYKRDGLKNCDSNGNSLGVLAKVKSKTNKYMYFPNDLENVGYNIFPESGIYGTMMFSRVYEKDGFTFDTKKNDFTTLSKNNIKVDSESKVARSIKSAIGNDVNNICIYQMSHHIYNNAYDAIKTLNLNRSGVYAIATSTFDGYNFVSFLPNLAYNHTLSKTTKLNIGAQQGVYCYIDNNGTCNCSYN